MRRRSFIRVWASSLLLHSLGPRAQPASDVPTIGFLGPPASAGGLLQAFHEGLGDFGYVVGRNIKVEYRYTDVPLQGRPERMHQLALELIRMQPRLLVVSVTEAALAAKEATSTIPIVMVSVSDPVAAGLVSSLARPGRNVTGLCRQTPELIGKDLQILTEMLGTMSEIGVLLNPADPLRSFMEAAVNEAAKSLDIRVELVEASAPNGLERAFSRLRATRVGAVLVLGGAAFYLNRQRIVQLALSHRLPSMYQAREFVEAGGLISYAPNTRANYRRAGYFVDRLLRGAKPAELPVELPSQYELVINLKTASALDVAIPQSLLLRANDTIR